MLLLGGACDDDRGTYTIKIPDASLDAGGAQLDAGVDGGAGDASTQPSVPGACTLEGTYPVPIEESGARAWAAVQHADSVHLAYVVRVCGETETTGTAIHRRSLRSTGEPEAPSRVTQGDGNTCETALSPALAVDGQGALQLFYTSDQPGSYELFRRALSAPGTSEQLTADPESARDNELETVAARIGGAPVVAYSNRLRRNDVGAVVTRVLGASELEVLPQAAGQSPVRLVLTEVLGPMGGGLLGWVNQSAQGTTVSMQPIAATGAATGERIELSAAGGENGSVAFASSATHAAVVYTTAAGSTHQLRYRQLDAGGRSSGPEVLLTSSNRSAVSASIAPYANGYVVAFREIPLELTTPASLKLMFITQQGVIGGERRLSDAARGGGESRVFVANDGRLITAWTDYSAAGSVLQVVRARCQ